MAPVGALTAVRVSVASATVKAVLAPVAVGPLESRIVTEIEVGLLISSA